MGIIPVNSIAGTCRWQGATYLRAPSIQTGREIGVRRGRKITSKRGECEFSECCNRHEWGLIDGSSGRRAWPGEILQIFITRRASGRHGRPKAPRAKKRRGRAISITRAQLHGQTHSGITNYSGKRRELCGDD